MLKLGANILHSQGCCSAPLNGFSVKHKRVYYSLYRFCSIVGMLPVLSLPLLFGEGVVCRLIILHHHFPAKFQPNDKARQGFERVGLDVFALDGARIKVGRSHARQQENEDKQPNVGLATLPRGCKIPYAHAAKGNDVRARLAPRTEKHREKQHRGEQSHAETLVAPLFDAQVG